MTKDDLDLDDLFTSRSRRGRQRTPGSPAKDSARLQSAQHERGTGDTFTPQVVTGETVTGATDIGEPDTPRGPTSTPRKADSKMTSSTASARQARRGGPGTGWPTVGGPGPASCLLPRRRAPRRARSVLLADRHQQERSGARSAQHLSGPPEITETVAPETAIRFGSNRFCRNRHERALADLRAEHRKGVLVG
jgi:hypothetical protein